MLIGALKQRSCNDEPETIGKKRLSSSSENNRTIMHTDSNLSLVNSEMLSTENSPTRGSMMHAIFWDPNKLEGCSPVGNTRSTLGSGRRKAEWLWPSVINLELLFAPFPFLQSINRAKASLFASL